MDPAHFDQLARLVSPIASRRHALLGLLLGVVPLGTRLNDAEAKRKKRKKKKTKKPEPQCQPGQHSVACGGVNINCTTSTGSVDGVCNTTTNNAAFCDNGPAFSGENCKTCAQDADCQPHCGPQAACIQCSGCI